MVSPELAIHLTAFSAGDAHTVGRKFMKDYYTGNFEFRERPSIILGPLESCLAQRIWINECISNLSDKDLCLLKFGDNTLINLPNVHYSMRDRLIASILLFGKFDAISGNHLLLKYLHDNGVIASRSEIFGEFLRTRKTPFAHPLAEGFIGSAPINFMPDLLQAKSITASIINTLRLSGFNLSPNDTETISTYVENRITRPNIIPAPGHLVHNTFFSILSVIYRSINSDIPLLSREQVAPEWKRDTTIGASVKILKIVWNEVKWLPQPKTLLEALDMSEDERIVGLRQSIDIWQHKVAIGDLNDISDIRAEVRNQVQYFVGKTWSSEIARLITYVALPIGVAETLLNSSPIGLSITTAGVASQSLADLIDQQKLKHWLSMGDDLIQRK